MLSDHLLFRDSILHGRYRLMNNLGSGGMSEVFLAEEIPRGRRVAIKRIRLDSPRDLEAHDRFLREAGALSRLDHENICPVLEVSQEGADRYLVMPFLEGTPLDRLIDGHPLPPERALPIARQIAVGMIEAHDKGVVHGDLKPANIMIDGQDRVKILDFGLARLRPAQGAPARSPSAAPGDGGALWGTEAYMAPERLAGDPADFRSDVYSFGRMLFEMLTGELPTDPPAGESPFPPIVPLEVQHLLREALTPDPERRTIDFTSIGRVLGQAGFPNDRPAPGVSPCDPLFQAR